MNQSMEELAFFYELGRATSQWANVEISLCKVTCQCITHVDPHILYVGFSSIENFRSKLSYADNLVKERFGETRHISDWDALCKKLGALSSKRNKLAHRMLIGIPNNPPGRRFALVEWGDAMKTMRRLSAKPIKDGKFPKFNPLHGLIFVSDLAEFRSEFVAMISSLENFSARVSGHVEPFQESPEPAKNRKTIRQIENQILEALGLPPKSSRKSL